MPSVNFTFFPIPINIHRIVTSTSIYTVPAGRFASAHLIASDGEGMLINGTRSVDSITATAVSVNSLWLNEGDTIQHTDTSNGYGSTISEFAK